MEGALRRGEVDLPRGRGAESESWRNWAARLSCILGGGIVGDDVVSCAGALSMDRESFDDAKTVASVAGESTA